MGLRRDADSEYGSALSPHISLVHHLRDNQTIRVSYSTAYRAPSLTESYSSQIFPLSNTLTAMLSGNPDLRPETIASTEIGYRKDLAQGYYGISVYDNRVANLIGLFTTKFQPAPYPPGTPSAFEFENVSSAHTDGFEIESGFQLAKRLSGIANYAYQDVVYENGRPVSLSPHHKINLPYRRI